MKKPFGIIEEQRCYPVTFFRYEPGNSSRYDVVIVEMSEFIPKSSNIAITITNLNRGGVVPSTIDIDVEYLAEKLRIGEGDAKPLLKLLNYFRHGE